MYWFLDESGNVLYVGKAKKLKNRIASYKQLKQLPGRLKRMVKVATELQFEILDSELEALLVEAELIKTHQPPYNIALKDDKSPLYVIITDEPFPRVLTIRKPQFEQISVGGTLIGPFPSGSRVKEILRIVRPIFPFCNKPRTDIHRENGLTTQSAQPRPCFYYHLGLCPGVCVGEIDLHTYQHQIEQLKHFLRGKKKSVIRDLETEMKQAAHNQRFETAAQLRDRVQLIKRVTDPGYRLKPELTLPILTKFQQVEGLLQLKNLIRKFQTLPLNYNLKRIEGYDVSNTQGQLASVAQVVLIDGQPAKEQYRLFNIRGLDTPNDYYMMKEAIARRQNHPEWGEPDLLVIDGGKGQLRAALQVWQWRCPVISIAKNPDRLIIPKRKVGEMDKQQYATLNLPPDHPALQLVQRVRDESHRFSKKQHVRRRDRLE